MEAKSSAVKSGTKASPTDVMEKRDAGGRRKNSSKRENDDKKLWFHYLLIKI